MGTIKPLERTFAVTYRCVHIVHATDENEARRLADSYGTFDYDSVECIKIEEEAEEEE